MLAAISLTVRPGEDDYELQLTEQAKINPALVRHLKTIHGIVFDVNAVTRMAYSTARFDPQPVLDRLGTLIQPIHGAEVEHNLLVSTFADLSGKPRRPVDQREPSPRRRRWRAPPPAERWRFPSSSPAASPAPTSAIPPTSCCCSTPTPTSSTSSTPSGPGTRWWSAARRAPARPRPPSTPSAPSSIRARPSWWWATGVPAWARSPRELDTLGLDSTLFQLAGNATPLQLKGQLVRAIVRNEKSLEPQLSNLHTTLIEHRHALRDHVASLHNVRQRWGCSPYQAMQSLAELTSIQPAPATTVRLKRSVLDNIRDREELAGRLRRAAELGSFSRASTTSPWHGARLLTRKETQEAQQVARSVAGKLPELRELMNGVAEHAEIRLGSTFAEWGDQVELLVAVRESLDKFTPDIFDRPVHDLISATAASSWRRERNIEMPSMQRSRLRRVAKEYVRPGVHIADLHSSLVLVQEQRAAWSDYATTQRHPAVPSGLAEIIGLYRELEAELAELGQAVRHTAAGGELHSTPYDELMERLERLVADTGDAGDPAGAHAPGGEHARARPRRTSRRPCRARSAGRIRGRGA